MLSKNQRGNQFFQALVRFLISTRQDFPDEKEKVLQKKKAGQTI